MNQQEFDCRFENLDESVVNALKLFQEQGLPILDLGNYKRPLVVGSGNAVVTGRILYEDFDAVFADESTYLRKLENISGIDGVVLISASGGKHAPQIAKTLKQRGLEVRLLTCNPNAHAREHIDSGNVFVFPKRAEPYTYNTSTYLGMILGKTRENPQNILDFIHGEINPNIPPDISRFDSFYFIVPERFDTAREMLLTKFDELFGPILVGRAFTLDQTRHAKTVVTNDKELFVSFGEPNTRFGERRVNLNLPEKSDYGTLIAGAYYFIGKIQQANPPYFKNSILEYCEKASRDFNQRIEPIVE